MKAQLLPALAAGLCLNVLPVFAYAQDNNRGNNYRRYDPNREPPPRQQPYNKPSSILDPRNPNRLNAPNGPTYQGIIVNPRGGGLY
jgi:hypothetical protein